MVTHEYKYQGSDGVDDDERMYQCFLYMRDPDNPNDLDCNHYALPLPISPVISTETMKVIRVDILPTGLESATDVIKPFQLRPPNEYVPEYQKLRRDLKPLNIVQPEGASFTVTEGEGISTLEWQKWHMRIGFNQREGMVLHDVSSRSLTHNPRAKIYHNRCGTIIGRYSIEYHSRI